MAKNPFRLDSQGLDSQGLDWVVLGVDFGRNVSQMLVAWVIEIFRFEIRVLYRG